MVLLLLCSCGNKEDSPKNGFSLRKPKVLDTTIIWDISSVVTSREERINFLLNQDSAFRHLREGYQYDGRFDVHQSGVSLGDTLWYENGEKEFLLQKLKKFSIAFPNTRFFVFSFKVNEEIAPWRKEEGYSLWFKQL